MLDLEVPPAAEEGEAGGGADAVPRIAVGPVLDATGNNKAASTPPPWTTAIEPA